MSKSNPNGNDLAGGGTGSPAISRINGYKPVVRPPVVKAVRSQNVAASTYKTKVVDPAASARGKALAKGNAMKSEAKGAAKTAGGAFVLGAGVQKKIDSSKKKK